MNTTVSPPQDPTERTLDGVTLPEIATLAEVQTWASGQSGPMVVGSVIRFVRYSDGPAADSAGGNVSRRYGTTHEAGLSVANLVSKDPEIWAPGDIDFTACAVSEYRFVGGYAWIGEGTVIGLGGDGEPVVSDVRPYAFLAQSVIDEAADHYREHGLR